MKMVRLSLNLLTIMLLVLAFSSVANAQATRTWVSGVGDDANPCSRTAPCKTWAGAISKTAPAGEIDCLDPGGFGAVTITKSITIDCDTTGWGGLVVSGTSGIVVAAGAGDDVTLRSIHINGLCAGPGANCGSDGVKVLSAKAVHILELDIFGMGSHGVEVATGATTIVTIADSNIHDNVGDGIRVNSTSGLAIVDVDHVAIWSCVNGVNAQNGSRVNVHNSTIFNNSVGILQSSVAGGGSSVTVVSSFFADGTALQSSAGGSIGASGNTFSQNGTVFNPAGGSISTAGDNPQFGNGATGAANGPAVTKI